MRKNDSHAERLLKSLGIDDPKEIDLEAIAFHVGALINYDDLKGCEASLDGYKDRAIITIRKNSIKTRQRFSIANELGHWQYHRGQAFECRIDDFGRIKIKDSREATFM